MLNTTLADLRCPTPGCKGALSLVEAVSRKLPELIRDESVSEIISGTILCGGCRKRFPILQGVSVLVPDVRDYLLSHVKGISRWVPDREIPPEIRKAFQKAREQIEVEHIEEDLEAERVTSLYVMNHYLHARAGASWWKAEMADSSPEIAEVIERFWDHGPFAKIREIAEATWKDEKPALVELGCGVGGLHAYLSGCLSRYLGVDSSFASIALARKLALGLPRPLESEEPVNVPGDLINGTVSQDVRGEIDSPRKNQKGEAPLLADYVVGDAVHPPLQPGRWDASAALNMIDMLDDPSLLPRLQQKLLRKGGLAIQSSPYVWHPEAARGLKRQTGENDSARAVEKLYRQRGFEIQKAMRHVPWLFFKHARQLEIYSVHLFFARSGHSSP
jgi:SAM-dependent methyltransferase